MKLVTYPNSWLEKKVNPFDFEKHDAKEVEKEMIEIMDKHQGVGPILNSKLLLKVKSP